MKKKFLLGILAASALCALTSCRTEGNVLPKNTSTTTVPVATTTAQTPVATSTNQATQTSTSTKKIIDKTLNILSLTCAADKEAVSTSDLADANGFFTIEGTLEKRLKEGASLAYGADGKNAGIKFILTDEAMLSAKISSNGSTNKSAFKLVKVVGSQKNSIALEGFTKATPTGNQVTGFEFDENTYEVSGTSQASIDKLLPAGTYILYSVADSAIKTGDVVTTEATYGRAGRFYSISVSNKNI